MTETYYVEPAITRYIGPVREYSPFSLPKTGNGYLAGTYPDGITRLDGVPAQAVVRVLYRPASGKVGDGSLVAEVQSSVSGEWRVDGLNENLSYDVVCRHEGYNDMILSNVMPVVD